LRPVKRFQDAFGSSAKTLVRNALFYPTGSIFAKHKIDHDDDSDGSNSDSSDSEKKPSNNEGWPRTDISKQWRSPRSRTIVKVFFSFLFYFIFTDTKVFLFCSYYLIGDYAQNLELPHFGAEQPQDIYYFSALTVNVFWPC
jgi:hypothetical protein